VPSRARPGGVHAAEVNAAARAATRRARASPGNLRRAVVVCRTSSVLRRLHGRNAERGGARDAATTRERLLDLPRGRCDDPAPPTTSRPLRPSGGAGNAPKATEAFTAGPLLVAPGARTPARPRIVSPSLAAVGAAERRSVPCLCGKKPRLRSEYAGRGLGGEKPLRLRNGPASKARGARHDAMFVARVACRSGGRGARSEGGALGG
jgi:hypothetical protein